jgi:3-oxoadipate enol-lactonase
MTWAWRSDTVESAGESIYFEVVGDDPELPWLVLTHGAGGSHAIWWQQIPALAAHHRVVTWDCRGFGNSTFRTGVLGASACGDDLLAVMDAAGADRAHLVGQSMGGWWVTDVTVRRPDRVRSLALCDTIGGLYTDELDAAFHDYMANARAEAARVGAHPALDEALFARDPALAFLYQQLGTFFTPPVAEMARALVHDRHTHAEVDATGVPVLVLAGSDDPIFPAPLLRQSAGRLARAGFVEIAGAGHSPYFERAPAWNDAVLAFLATA